MRGSIRHRGDERAGSWEYIVDTGVAAAQRCQSCGKRLAVKRKPRDAGPERGSEPIESGERRHHPMAAVTKTHLDEVGEGS